MASIMEKIQDVRTFVQTKTKQQPTWGLILGSGLGELADEIQHATVIPFHDLPHFPQSTVQGHAGKIVIGELAGKMVLAMQGRFHYYEGYAMDKVTFPVRVMKALGIDQLIVTNACGGMNPAFEAGQLMLITDHINFMGTNPLIGENVEQFGPRFPDMSRAYDRVWIEKAAKCAEGLGIKVQKGVYAAISGPAYMTPAELNMLRGIGGDAVGMSTVPEVIVANHMGMRVLGVSCITDMAIADTLEPLTHEQVMATAERTKPQFKQLIQTFLAEM